jgi:hypothetical protein
MWQPGRRGVNHPRRPWQEALDLPGAAQMQFAKQLLLSRPYLSRIPDQSLVKAQPHSDKVEVQHHLYVTATRDANGAYALLYFPANSTVEVDCSLLSGSTLRAHWYNPRSGESTLIEEFERTNSRPFTPPEWGPDWVLVLDDASRNFQLPGNS